MSTERQPSPDWAQIQTEYEDSAASLRVLGAAHGVSYEAIRKHAKAEGWVRGAIRGIERRPTAVEPPAPVMERTKALKPRKRSPRRILEEIAADRLAPAAAR